MELAKAVEAMGAGEIMLNCIDNDGKGQVRHFAVWDPLGLRSLGFSGVPFCCIACYAMWIAQTLAAMQFKRILSGGLEFTASLPGLCVPPES